MQFITAGQNTTGLRGGYRDSSTDSRTMVFLLAIFFICPFAAFILALTQAKKRSSYVIYALWGMIFVWHMNPTGSARYDDLEGIMERFSATTVTFDQLMVQLHQVITFDDNAPKEWYETAMIWLTKTISNNPHLYFVLCSIPWLFFELSSLRRITSDPKFRQSFICLVILLLFVAPRDILTLQNPRFTTGTWMAIFATTGYFLNKHGKLIYAALIFLLPLVHSAFWFYVGMFVLGNAAYRFPKFSTMLLYCSLPFSYMSYDLLYSINISSLPIPSVMNAWITRYMSEDFYSTFVANDGASGYYWVTNIFDFIKKTAYLLVPLYLIKEGKKYKGKSKMWDLAGYFIFFYAVVSFIQFVPVLGERFYWLVQIFAIFIWFKLIYPRHNWVIWLMLFGCSWGLFRRYFYHGAVESSVPLEIFWEPLPLAIADMW